MSRAERIVRKEANEGLWKLTSNRYHDGLPISEINHILETAGLEPLEEAIYCGREGQMSQQVGPNSWFSMTWYKMEVTGRYEVVAYVS